MCRRRKATWQLELTRQQHHGVRWGSPGVERKVEEKGKGKGKEKGKGKGKREEKGKGKEKGVGEEAGGDPLAGAQRMALCAAS